MLGRVKGVAVSLLTINSTVLGAWTLFIWRFDATSVHGHLHRIRVSLLRRLKQGLAWWLTIDDMILWLTGASGGERELTILKTCFRKESEEQHK